MPKNSSRPLTIGWKEFVDFPDWGVRHVKVKVDTGARTSALGALSYDLSQVEGIGLVAEMRLALRRKHPERIKVVRARVLGMVVVACLVRVLLGLVLVLHDIHRSRQT